MSNTKARLKLIYEVGKKIGSVSRMARLWEHILEMTPKTLNAWASSIFLFGDNGQQLFFEAASVHTVLP
jgi:hypothetical protein